jgi:hypothetical protein
MPTFDEELRDRIRAAAPPAKGGNELLDHLATRKRRRATVRRVGTIATVAVILLGTIVAFAIIDRGTPTTTPVGEPPPSSTVPNLGLAFPICHVSTMPIQTGSGTGVAAVLTKETDQGCPGGNEATVLLGVDVDGDGALDATAVSPLPDCYVECQMFATPDVNGDGVSEVGVATTGADGYGITLYAVALSPPSIDPVQLDGHPFSFAWADVAAHASSAGCATDAGAPAFVIWNIDKSSAEAIVEVRAYAIDGTTARMQGQHRYRTGLDDVLPYPGDEICGAPVAQEIARSVGEPSKLAATTTDLCDVSTVRADVDGGGTTDVAFVGEAPRQSTCPPIGTEREGIVAVDTNGDGVADGRIQSIPDCLACRAVAAIDFNADGASELVVLIQGSSTPGYAIYGWASDGRGPGMYPAKISSGSEQFPEADELRFAAGGDEGFSGAVECEGYPGHPGLVVWAANAPVDGGANATRDVVMTKLTMGADGSFSAVDALHQRQPAADPLPFDVGGTGCGIDWATGTT